MQKSFPPARRYSQQNTKERQSKCVDLLARESVSPTVHCYFPIPRVLLPASNAVFDRIAPLKLRSINN
eukprot:scaffold259362_cov18-Prasinocladus_malaysianus.AAC.1